MLHYFWETFRLGLKSILLHKLRSFLTTLGILFGVLAVIVMVAIGEGAKKRALEQVEQLGARNILVRSQRPPETSEGTQRSQRVLRYGITRGDLELLKTLPHIRTLVYMRDTEQRVLYNDRRANVDALGATATIFPVINLRLARGRYFTAVDEQVKERVCVLGYTAAQEIFPSEDPIGRQIRVGTGGMSTIYLTVVGVLEPTGLRPGTEGSAIMQRDLDKGVYFPVTVARDAFGDQIVRRQAGTFERKEVQISEVWMEAESVDHVETLSALAENVMRVNRRGGEDFVIKAPIEILRQAEAVARIFNFTLGAIAGVSLLVGGIGIMNIMLASVTERTREIGIRRALGAKRRDIVMQFLIETTVVCLAGGLIGVALGIGVASLVPWLTGGQYQTAVTTWSVVLSFVVAAVTGTAFGLYPAVKAAQMDPIEALRHE